MIDTDLNINKVMNKQENIETLKKQLDELSQKLEHIKVLAGKEQGRWVVLNSDEAPEWTMPFKKIINIIEN
jgi:hypothetical protein